MGGDLTAVNTTRSGQKVWKCRHALQRMCLICMQSPPAQDPQHRRPPPLQASGNLVCQRTANASSSPTEGQQLARHLHATVSQGCGGPQSSSGVSCTCACITNHFLFVDRHGSFSLCDLITTHCKVACCLDSPHLSSGSACRVGCLRFLVKMKQVNQPP